MPRTPQLTAYKALLTALAEAAEHAGLEVIAPADLRPITDDELAVLLNHEEGLAFDAARPAEYADILNGVLYTSDEDRNAALGLSLRHSLTHEARTYLVGEVNVELENRMEPVGGCELTERSMDEAGVSHADFA